MLDVLYQTVGRITLLLDPLRSTRTAPPIRAPRLEVQPGKYDWTGLVSHPGVRPRILHRDAGVLYVEHDSFAHAFWRAQEFSLFEAIRPLLAQPILDFGCGDGSFAAALFDHVEFGVDNNPEVLASACTRGVYGNTVRATDNGIPLPDGAAHSVIANSVLEHVLPLEQMLRELRRVLAQGGLFAFTVPLPAYTRHLSLYFGPRAAARVNRESVHRHLMEPEAWIRLLALHGFRVERIRRYQPARFTFWYRIFRLLGPRGLTRFFPSLPEYTWRRYSSQLVAMVKDSIENQASDGANLFVLAR
jgi:SAM-dependent methyltransferase